MKPYTDEQLAHICQNLAYLYHSGTALDKALSYLDFGVIENPQAWVETYRKNAKMSRVFEDDGHFPADFIDAFRVAEKVGNEEHLCLRYVKHFRRQHELKQYLKDSLSLPLLLLFIFSVLLALMAFSILPLFERLMVQLGIQESLSLVMFLTFLKGFSIVLSLLWMVAIAWIGLAYLKHRKHPLIYVSWEERVLQLFRNALTKRNMAEFSSLAYLAIAGGIDNKTALTMVHLNHPSKQFLERFNQAQNHLLPHEGLYELLLCDGFYDALSLASLKTAAQSGQLETALDECANRLTQEAHDELSRQMERIEPWLISGLTVLVFAMVFAMVIPLLDVLSSLG